MNQHYFDVPFAFAGDVSSIPDPLQVSGSVSMTEGWNFNYQRDLDTDPAARPIDRSTMNWLLLQVTTALQALQQSSTAEFITAAQNGGVAFSYGLGSVVLWSASGNAPFVKYVSITSANTNTPSAGDPQGLTTGWQTVADAIATAAQATAGTNDYSIMTPLKVAQQTALRALLAGSSSQVFNVGAATTTTQAPQATQVQASAFNYAGVVGGTANALTATLAPAPASYTDDLVVVVRVLASNTTTATLNLNGLGATAIVGAGHVALQGGELIATGFACFAYSTSLAKFVLLWSTGGGEQIGNATQSQHALTAGQAITQNVIAFTTAGTAPAYTLTPTIPLSSYAANQRFRVKFNAAGTTGSNTLNISGLGAVTLGQYNSAGTLLPAVITNGMLTDVEYNGSAFVVLNELPQPGALLNTIIYTNPTGTLLVSVNGSAYSAAGSSTYNPLSAFCTSVEIDVLGGGGGGGGAAATGVGQCSFGSGGGGGGWVRKRLSAGFSAQTITVGQGGTTSAGGVGGVGGASSFGASWSATGGGGGAAVAASAPTNSPSGSAAGGIGVIGDINSTGGFGSFGFSYASGLGGSGGNSLFGIGGPFVTGGANGSPGGGYGGGGGGASNSASLSARAGGVGICGLVMIKEYA